MLAKPQGPIQPERGWPRGHPEAIKRRADSDRTFTGVRLSASSIAGACAISTATAPGRPSCDYDGVITTRSSEPAVPNGSRTCRPGTRTAQSVPAERRVAHNPHSETASG